MTFILYVDESGDPGAQGFSPHYILTGLDVPAIDWAVTFDR